MRITIREIRQSEYHVLEEFLYQAIYVPEGVSAPPRSILNEPSIAMYIAEFGEKPDDHCFVAVEGEKIIGAVWARKMQDYGYVDDETPSLSISVLEEHRGRGIGTRLLRSFLHALRNMGYQQVSLSVQKTNPAVFLYEKLGFHVVRENDEDSIMVNRLS